jgi:glycosyltransferase involved in cell wall biosynthesis
MLPFYAACDVIALPSRAEGFPYSMLEAAAAGRAVVATNVAGIRDAVEDGVTGLLTEPASPALFTEAMQRLFRDKDLCNRLGRHGRQRVERVFSRQAVLRAFLKFYQLNIVPEAAFDLQVN